jgi:hypothetical protein
MGLCEYGDEPSRSDAMKLSLHTNTFTQATKAVTGECYLLNTILSL